MAVIPIFVSSTFRDFHTERDELMASVLPALNDQVAEYGCWVEIIDLRWGVSDADLDDEVRQARVLAVCLSEIERARPLFVGLLGERYGWVPDELRLALAMYEADISDYPSGISVTALEFEYGALRRTGSGAVFLERELVGAVPPGWRDQHPGLVTALKTRVRRHCSVHSYRVVSDGARVRELGDFVACATRVLGAEVLRRAQEVAGDRVDPVSAAESLFFEDRLRAFDGRGGLVSAAVDRVRNGNGVCLIGESGIGKSSVWCAAVRQLVDGGARVVAVSAGASPEISTLRAVLIRACAAVGVVEGLVSLVDEDLENAFRAALAAAAPLVLAVDGIDQILGHANPTFLSGLPAAVTVLTSTTSPDQTRYAAAQNITVLEVTPLASTDSRLAVGAICAALRRRLPALAVDLLTARSRTPLWIRLAVAELSALDAEDFSGVDPGADPITAIADLVTATVRDLPASTGDLVSRIIDRAVDRFGEREVRAFLAFAVISRSGLRSVDFEALAGLNALTIAGIRRALSGLLIARGEGGRLGFTHAIIRSHIAQRFVAENDEAPLHSRIARYFAESYAHDPLCEEDRLWHIFRAGDLSASPILNKVAPERQSRLSAVVIDSARERGLEAGFRGLDSAGVSFLAGAVHEHKSAMRADARVTLCLQLLSSAQGLFESSDVGEVELRMMSNAAGCVADLPSSLGTEKLQRERAVDSLAFARRLVERYPAAARAHEVLGLLSMWFARESDDPAEALEARRTAVEEWERVAAREPSKHADAWLQFALSELGGMELRIGDHRAARAVYEKALNLTRRLFAENSTPEYATNVINALNGLGAVCEHENRGEDMLRYYSKALGLAEWSYSTNPGRGAIEQLAVTSRMYGLALYDEGHVTDSYRWLSRSCDMYRIAGEVDPENAQWPFRIDTIGRLAGVEIVLGHVETARERISGAINSVPEPGAAVQIAPRAIVQFARGRIRTGDFGSAELLCTEAVRIFEDRGADPADHVNIEWARAFVVLAEVQDRQGRDSASAASLRAAIGIRQAMVDKSASKLGQDEIRELGMSLINLALLSDPAERHRIGHEIATLWSRRLADDRGSVGPKNLWLAKRLANLAMECRADAEALFTAAMGYASGLVESEPDNHEYVAACIGVTDVSAVFSIQNGNTRKAVELWLAAARSADRKPNHPDLLGMQRSVANNLLRVSGQYDLPRDLAAKCRYWSDRLRAHH
ncbi:DUF4062 domain-containing protein [Nocardia sp. NPDC049737]|uniref:DUF4062 domain-containing protein n=1 Tax=Nocardia sp. NPDC049737 TaxID=3154358 RepID=UPI00342BBF84